MALSSLMGGAVATHAVEPAARGKGGLEGWCAHRVPLLSLFVDQVSQEYSKGMKGRRREAAVARLPCREWQRSRAPGSCSTASQRAAWRYSLSKIGRAS